MGTSRSASGFVQEQRQRGFQGGQRQLAGPHDPHQGILADRLDQRGAAENDPALRAADQLVGAAGDQIGSATHRFGQRRLGIETESREVHQRTGAHVVDHDQPVGHVRVAPTAPSGTSAVKPLIL